jgi:hypothetical protein
MRSTEVSIPVLKVGKFTVTCVICVMAALAGACLRASANERTASAIDRLCLAYKLTPLDDVAVRTALNDAARTRGDVQRGLAFFDAGWRVAEARNRVRDGGLLDAIAESADCEIHSALEDLAGSYRADILPMANYSRLALLSTAKDLEQIADASRFNDGIYRLRRSYAVYRGLNSSPTDAYEMAIEDLGEAESGIRTLRQTLLSIGRLTLTGYAAADAERDGRAFLESSYAFEHPKASDISGVRPADSAFDFMSLRVADAIRRDNQTMIRPVKTIIEQVIHGSLGGGSRQVGNRTTGAGPESGVPQEAPPLGEPPSFEQIGLPLWLENREGWQRWEWTQWAARNIPFMSGHEGKKGPWWKLRQPDSSQKSWLNKYMYAKAGSRIVFYVWWWGTGDTSAFFAAGDSEKVVPLQGRFSLGTSGGKVVRVELEAPKPDVYGRIWLHFSGTGKFAMSIGKLYSREGGG